MGENTEISESVPKTDNTHMGETTEIYQSVPKTRTEKPFNNSKRFFRMSI